MIVPTLVVAEVAYLVERELGAGSDAAFYRSIANGELAIEPVADDDWERMAQLVEQCRTFGSAEWTHPLWPQPNGSANPLLQRSTAATSA